MNLEKHAYGRLRLSCLCLIKIDMLVFSKHHLVFSCLSFSQVLWCCFTDTLVGYCQSSGPGRVDRGEDGSPCFFVFLVLGGRMPSPLRLCRGRQMQRDDH